DFRRKRRRTSGVLPVAITAKRQDRSHGVGQKRPSGPSPELGDPHIPRSRTDSPFDRVGIATPSAPVIAPAKHFDFADRNSGTTTYRRTGRCTAKNEAVDSACF